jgi:hypothetical protein
VDYQPISELAQLQALQHLLRLVLDGIFLSIGVASVCLLCLCVSELRLPRRRPSEAKERGWSASRDARSELGPEGPNGFAFRHSPPNGDLALRGNLR